MTAAGGSPASTQPERPAWLAEQLFPFESRFVELDGNRVHYIDEGEGPCLLFLHGNPTYSLLYRDIVRALRDRYRCVALDYPGFGLSTASVGYRYSAAEHADVVERFVIELDLRDMSLMGQDWGGPIGLSVATRHPERFSGLILGNTWAWPLNGDLQFEAFARILSTPPAQLAIERFNAFVNVMIPLGTRRTPPAAVMDAYRAPFRTVEARGPAMFPRELLAARPFLETLYADLTNIRHLPALFVWGEHDPALRARVELAKLQALFPDHTTVLLDARHFIQEDAPHEIVEAIASWRSRVSDPSYSG